IAVKYGVLGIMLGGFTILLYELKIISVYIFSTMIIGAFVLYVICTIVYFITDGRNKKVCQKCGHPTHEGKSCRHCTHGAQSLNS
ncbi:hypothetical protein LCGC14_1598580, partial [marine sediment metagenome]